MRADQNHGFRLARERTDHVRRPDMLHRHFIQALCGTAGLRKQIINNSFAFFIRRAERPEPLLKHSFIERPVFD
jgi:hypothetical protein